MLIDLLNQVIRQVDSLDPQLAAPDMLEQVRINRPDTLSRMVGDPPPEVADQVSNVFALALVALVKKIPEIIHRLVEPLQNRSHDAGTRCALASVLAYVAQPRDLVPDSAPGGYGFLDDYILARTALIEYLRDIDYASETTTDTLKNLTTVLPKHVQPQMQQAVDGVSMAYQMMRALPPFVVDMITDQIIANPLAAGGAAMPQPGTFHTGPDMNGGFWGKSGAYIEGNDIILPGGGGLIGGELFIPD